MRVKVLSYKNKDKENEQAKKCVGEEGEVYFPLSRMVIPAEKSTAVLTTSKIQKITVETKNSIYELEVVEDIEEEDENE